MSLRGCSTHAVQSNTLLVYASAQKNSAMELRENTQPWNWDVRGDMCLADYHPKRPIT